MNPNENPDLSVTRLLALRKENDAMQVITDLLKVKEMGPADHIRTKHEAKAFVETGDVKAAEALIKQASERTAAHQAIANRMTEQQTRGQSMTN